MELVAEASNGREALEQFRKHRPDITLMDLQMPEIGGIDAISAIRAEFPGARIIVLTTHGFDHSRRRCSGFSRSQSGRAGILAEGLAAKRTAGHDPRGP
jgi:DNA-binding NarL/FixJ family response regulator